MVNYHYWCRLCVVLLERILYVVVVDEVHLLVTSLFAAMLLVLMPFTSACYKLRKKMVKVKFV